MKKLILGLIIGVSFTALVGAGIESYVVNKTTAEAKTYKDIIVFTDSKPVHEFEFLGTVKVHLAVNGRYEEMRDILVKNAKKKYSLADAIIMNGDKADVIRFK